LEGNGAIKLVSKRVDELTGCIKTDVWHNGFIKGKNTFFPPNWTKEQCLLKVKEALHHLTEAPIFEQGKWTATGITSEGIKIKTVIETTGELVTSYPLLENLI